MKISLSIACDHAGLSLKAFVLDVVQSMGYEVIDHGVHTNARVDYPDFAAKVAQDVQSAKARFGILICGSGTGMALTANRFAGIRAAAISDVYSAKMARAHNDLNVLCLGSRVLGEGPARLIMEAFLKTEFEGGRHAERVQKIHAYD